MVWSKCVSLPDPNAYIFVRHQPHKLLVGFWKLHTDRVLQINVGPHHYVLRSLGEVVVLVVVSCLMLAIGHNHRHGSDEVAVLVTVVAMDVDAVCLISLLTPDHHSSLLEAIVTLTLHLVGLLGSSNLRIFAMFLVFLILLVKNFQWRHVGDAQNDQHYLIWDAQEAV
ncbi:uncharacterized protein LOC114731466 isoform X2 [Neltuma alba]|uniref:uncharacterized protein LOC114731466 isoform X2 n=1 Tax=Neltuma alba TaxID=207710 RepID=UPI0010A35729|nr:uncharacterized protein LOC114731466 isoform X2 [Prosopis alba]